MSDPVPYLPVVDEVPAALQTNQVIVPTAGTAVVLGSGALAIGVIVQALAANVSNVYVGNSGVTSSNGYQLQPGQATSFCVSNLSALYVNAVTSGDGICFGGS
jgi:hypothetical protein